MYIIVHIHAHVYTAPSREFTVPAWELKKDKGRPQQIKPSNLAVIFDALPDRLRIVLTNAENDAPYKALRRYARRSETPQAGYLAAGRFSLGIRVSFGVVGLVLSYVCCFVGLRRVEKEGVLFVRRIWMHLVLVCYFTSFVVVLTCCNMLLKSIAAD